MERNTFQQFCEIARDVSNSSCRLAIASVARRDAADDVRLFQICDNASGTGKEILMKPES